jgi:hypothetical protein
VPGYVYFTPLRPGHYRVYSQPERAFWCCVGSGMENPGRYGKFVYARAEDGIYVNLFIASKLTVSDGFTVHQETVFPDEPRTRLRMELAQPAVFTLHLRHPAWVDAEGFAVRINGRAVDVSSSPSSYAEIRREWKNGDVVHLDLPMRTAVERLPDGSAWVAIMHGPILLAHPAGDEDLLGLRADDSRMGHVASGPMPPLDRVPVLVATPEDLLAHIKPEAAERPMHFRLTDVVYPRAPQGLPLVPFFRLHDSRYQIYWQLVSEEGLKERREQLAAEERARAAREAATLDRVAIGEQQPEAEHNFAGENTETGLHRGRRWRHGKRFQYTLNTQGEKAVDLVVTYWGGDRGRRFNIFADSRLVAEESLEGDQPGEFIVKRYPVPADVLEAATHGQVTVKFVATQWLAGGVFDVRLMKADK